MAKVKLDLPTKASFGNVSMYLLNGKLVFRTKGGASGTRIKKDPQFENQRKQMSRFGGYSTAAKMIRESMPTIKHLAHPAFHGDLVNVCASIMDMETTIPVNGRKPILFANGLPLIEGFQLNKENTFDAVITTPVSCSLNRADHSATIQLPPLLPGKNFKIPWTYPFFRLRLTLGIIRDMSFNGVAYTPITPDIQEYADKWDSEWCHVKDDFPRQEVILKLENPVFDSNCYLMVTAGIEFGIQKNGRYQHVKHAGCGKILSVG